MLHTYLHTLNAIRVHKCNEQCPGDNQNAVLSLYDLRDIHINCIQRIDLFPFATHYSTPSQMSWFKNEFGKGKRCIISIDASGIGLQPPIKFKKCILLYVMGAQGMYQISTQSDFNVQFEISIPN